MSGLECCVSVWKEEHKLTMTKDKESKCRQGQAVTQFMDVNKQEGGKKYVP